MIRSIAKALRNGHQDDHPMAGRPSPKRPHPAQTGCECCREFSERWTARALEHSWTIASNGSGSTDEFHSVSRFARDGADVADEQCVSGQVHQWDESSSETNEPRGLDVDQKDTVLNAIAERLEDGGDSQSARVVADVVGHDVTVLRIAHRIVIPR